MEYDNDLKDNEPRRSKWLTFCVPLMALSIILIVLVPLGVFYIKPHLRAKKATPATTNILVQVPLVMEVNPELLNPAQLGQWAGTVLDPSTWLDKTSFNTTFTDEMIGGLSMMGLYSKWSNNVRANPFLPALANEWEYGAKPIHGVTLSGWLHLNSSITSAITPSESQWSASMSQTKGLDALKMQLETHYSQFITEKDIKEIADTGMDHIKIPVGYWAVRAPLSDPHLGHVSWRYLLRGLEWARKYGLRVCVELTSDVPVPEGFGSRVVDQLAQFLAQDRYRQLVTMLEVSLMEVNTKVYETIRGAGFTGIVLGHDVGVIDQVMAPNADSFQQRIATVCSVWQPLVKARGASIVAWDLDDGSALGNVSTPLYRAYLKDFGRGQVAVFDQSWGWFYRAWKGPDVRRSYQKGLEAGVLSNFNATGEAVHFVCDASTDYAQMGLY